MTILLTVTNAHAAIKILNLCHKKTPSAVAELSDACEKGWGVGFDFQSCGSRGQRPEHLQSSVPQNRTREGNSVTGAQTPLMYLFTRLGN
jgi:hypothetical protein